MEMEKRFHSLGNLLNCLYWWWLSELSCLLNNIHMYFLTTDLLEILKFKSVLFVFVSLFQMTLRDSDPVVLVKSFCSCVAGTGLCNHLVALLYQTAHYSQCGMSVVPPVLSCTETEQKWHKPRTMVSVINRSIKMFDCYNPHVY